MSKISWIILSCSIFGVMQMPQSAADISDDIVILSTNKSEQGVCDLYLAPSHIPGAGRGIFAGRNYEKDETIDTTSSLTLLRKNGRKWPLNNYVYSSNENKYSMVLFGVPMLFNHHLPKDVDHYWENWPVAPVSEQRKEAHTIHTGVSHITARNIDTGEEIFTSYGDKEWFTLRNIPHDDGITNETSSKKYSLEELEKVGHCVTNVIIDESTQPIAGNGIFAKKDFKKGEIVSISPVLILPKHDVAKDEGVLLNYCISIEGSDVALLPVGLGALANHGGSSANLEMTWYAWSDEEGFATKFKQSPEILFTSQFAQLDLAYRATRDISAGEELYISYGELWEQKWIAHLDALNEWIEEDSENELNIATKPQFRQTIGAPEGLFPKWWRVTCIGEECQMVNIQAGIDKDPVLKKKQEEARIKAQEAIARARALAQKNYVKPDAGTCSKSSQTEKSSESASNPNFIKRMLSYLAM
eukprot:gene4474-8909_t